MKIANIHEAKSSLSKLIELAIAGEDVIIAKAGKPVVKIIAYKPQKDRVPGAWKGKVTMSDDFNEEDQEINSMFYGDVNLNYY
ncbi:MAG: type II toxin-antitoxin system prevent-host-death family antitoxin [Cyanobacteria bacterium P01_F01_bin.143]